jgi:hypothetical protein
MPITSGFYPDGDVASHEYKTTYTSLNATSPAKGILPLFSVVDLLKDA